MARIREAKASGLWDQPDRPTKSLEMSDDLKTALAGNRVARSFFDQLAPSYQKQYVGWIAAAKRRETRDRRIRESIALLEKGEKLGIR
jgi:uncharacterized protein YdeI (YjbR/CyaY-like superfamily)